MIQLRLGDVNDDYGGNGVNGDYDGVVNHNCDDSVDGVYAYKDGMILREGS